MTVKRFTLFTKIFLLSTLYGHAITIGQGPALQNSLGTSTDKRGTTWYEEFQDWAASDIRALDYNDDQYKFNNAQDTSRDIVAFYSHDDGTNIYFRFDFFDIGYQDENSEVDVYVAIDCAPGGNDWLPDFSDTKTDHPWELCIGVYNSSAASVYHTDWTNYAATEYVGSYWRADLDSVEFAITRAAMLDAGWDGTSAFYMQPFTCRDGTDGGNGEIDGQASDLVDVIGTLERGNASSNGWYLGAISSEAATGRAKYAVVAHANQSVAPQSGTQGHIYTDRTDLDLHPGFIRMLDSAEMLNTPVNLHISGTLLISLQWARQDPSDATYPDRDGPTFNSRVAAFVTNGPGSLIGGVLAEHIMPYFEGEVNRKSIQQNSELIASMFGLTENDMQVMHTPERVIRSDTNSPYVSSSGPLDGKTFADIEASGFAATYLDEVTHLHWWFYADEQNNPGWDTNNWGRWAGGQGNDEETYHHKVHKINGVYCFMINDREDQSKFGNTDGGMELDTRYTLLAKALHPDSSQLTLVFDDWEAFAGNSFASATPNNNADQWHNTLRWAANHPWIELVNLKDVLHWATNDSTWVVDQGYVYDKGMQTYEWLKHASEHSYDHWYYGFTNSGDLLEESFFSRVPYVHESWAPGGMKPYGDMNTTNSLIRDAWDTIQEITATNLKALAEWGYSAMIYETAWHDENEPAWWPPVDKPWLSWSDAYQSRNYQTTFDRAEANSYEDGLPTDDTSGWAVRLHAHVRDMGVLKAASDWVASVKNGTQGPTPLVYAADLDDDTLDEYVLCNNRVFACVERWGARLIKAFVYDPDLNGGDAREVIGVPISNPAQESENEDADNNRCSAFKDRYNTGLNGNHYVDMDFAAPLSPIQGSNSWTFTSQDGNITKHITLADGRDVIVAEYTITTNVGALYTRQGLGPNQMDLMLHGHTHLVKEFDPSYTGLRNTQGGAVYLVLGHNVALVPTNIANTGWEARELPLIEQFETCNTATNFSIALAFSQASAADLDGDGLDNTNEFVLGTNHESADSDGDGMPDGYEVSYGLMPTNAADAAQDLDGDGISNHDEYIANTCPDSSNAYPHISSIVFSPTGIQVQSFTTPDRQFEILFADATQGFSDSLDWNTFNNTNLLIGTWLETNHLDSTFTFLDDFSGNTSGNIPGGSRYYRIRISLP
ncbi:MAG: hypothetical protein EOM20_16365 [Spartobacteria bacterium]|nr:hypothetical protein [Spartobacteria bacterium]